MNSALSGASPQIIYHTLITNFQQAGYSITQCPYDWRRPSMATVLGQVSSHSISVYLLPRGAIRTSKLTSLPTAWAALSRCSTYLSSPERASRVHAVVTLGTPYLGTLKSLMLLRYGKTMIEQLDNIASSDYVRNVSRNAPGVYQITPLGSVFQCVPPRVLR